MAKTVIVRLTDDIDGGDAAETVHFALDGRSYEIDVNKRTPLGSVRPSSPSLTGPGRAAPSRRRARARAARRAVAEKTMYSELKDEEKARFRTWANMATARRISDARVRSWIAAGRP